MIEVGTMFGAYKVEAPVGRGGMASVYKAYHAPTDRHVALKVMLPEIAVDETFRARFEREAKVLAGLQHIHILPVFDYGQQDETTYLVMPLLPGKTLRNHIKDAPLTLKEVQRLFSQLAGALDYAHKQNVLHRDIKPANIMLDASDNALLADFGLTRLIAETHTNQLTADSAVIGTPLYMSPEQGQGRSLDHRSDLYSLSVVLYEMLTGVVPYTAETPVAVIFKHIQEPVPTPLMHRPDLPNAIEDVLNKALAKDPADRYDTATEIVDALAAASVELPSGTVYVKRPPGSETIADPGVVKQEETTAAASVPDMPNLTPVEGVNTPAAVGATIADEAAVPSPSMSTPPSTATPPYATPEKKAERRSMPVPIRILIAVLVLGLGGTGVFFSIGGFGGGSDGLQQTLAFEAHRDGVVSMNTNDDLLITGGRDSLAFVWSMSQIEEMAPEELQRIEGNSGSVTTVAIRPDGEEYLTSGSGGTEYTWYADTGNLKITNMLGTNVAGGDYSADSRLIANVYTKTLSVGGIIDPENSEYSLADLPAQPINPNDETFTALSFSDETLSGADGEVIHRIVTADRGGFIQQWEVGFDESVSQDDVMEVLQEGGTMDD
ncbi:MAG: protein kinase, partial [Chloroflexota bacterium]